MTQKMCTFKRRRFFSRVVVTFFLIVSVTGVSFGQTDQRAQAIQRLQDLASSYRKASHLSFNITYRYSAELKPTTYLDSLTGSFKLNGNSFWYGIDNTEFLGNDTVNLAVFNQDQVIYINGNSVVRQSANPLAMIDSVLLNNQYNSATITTVNGIDHLIINFQSGFQFKKVEYFIDAKSGLILRMIGIIHSQEMYDPEVQPLFNKSQAFGILDITFSNYQAGSFTDQALDPARYFIRANNVYQGVGSYSTYKIYNGSSKP